MIKRFLRWMPNFWALLFLAVPVMGVATFVLAVVMLPLAALFWPLAGVAWFALVTTYFTIAMIAAIDASRRFGWGLFWLMPLVFACYHVGYGLGFIVGLIDMLCARHARRPYSSTSTRRI